MSVSCCRLFPLPSFSRFINAPDVVVIFRLLCVVQNWSGWGFVVVVQHWSGWSSKGCWIVTADEYYVSVPYSNGTHDDNGDKFCQLDFSQHWSDDIKKIFL